MVNQQIEWSWSTSFNSIQYGNGLKKLYLEATIWNVSCHGFGLFSASLKCCIK